MIEIRRKDVEASKNVFDADRLFAELEALEWLQDPNLSLKCAYVIA